MKRMGWAVLFLAAAGWLGAVEPGEKAAQDELKKLEGSWAYTATEFNGKKLADGVVTIATLTIKGNTYKIEALGNVTDEGTFTFDPTKKPKTLDKVSTRLKNFKMVAIYEVDGDTLRICENASERPKKFSSMDPAFTSLHTLKRKK
jgi:uncharacterized protein (TIGR03067 family)